MKIEAPDIILYYIMKIYFYGELKLFKKNEKCGNSEHNLFSFYFFLIIKFGRPSGKNKYM